jgi:hypothetical protein
MECCSSHYVIPETGVRRRHHLHESVLQKAFQGGALSRSFWGIGS